MLLFIKDKQTYFFLLLLLSIGVGLQIIIYKIAIIALLLQWLLSADYKQKFVKLTQNNFAVGLIGLYFLYAISFFWSDNEVEAIIDMILKTPLLILPLVILSQNPLSAKQINQLLLSFALSSVLLNLFCFGDAYFSFLNTNQINEFYFYHLAINMHPAYQAMFTCFSIVFFVYLFIKEEFISSRVAYPIVAVQMIFILLFSSRMQILIMMGIVPVYFIAYFYQRKKSFIGLLYTALIFGFAYLLMSSIPSSLNSRYKKTISYINSVGVGNDNFDPRKIIWTEGLEVIKNNWFIGAGSGDAKDILVARYSKLILENPISDNLVDSIIVQMQKNEKTALYLKEKAFKSDISYEEQLSDYAKTILKSNNDNYKMAFQRAYNFHNQYLQTFGTIGVFGLLLLCYLVGYPLLLSIRDKEYLRILFLVIMGASFLTESMFERQAGIVFFALFYVLLIGRASQNKLF